MASSFVSQPTKMELCAKVCDSPEGYGGVSVVFEVSSSPLKEGYAQTDNNVFQFSQPRTLRTAYRGLSGARPLLAQAIKAEVAALSRNA